MAMQPEEEEPNPAKEEEEPKPVEEEPKPEEEESALIVCYTIRKKNRMMASMDNRQDVNVMAGSRSDG